MWALQTVLFVCALVSLGTLLSGAYPDYWTVVLLLLGGGIYWKLEDVHKTLRVGKE